MTFVRILARTGIILTSLLILALIVGYSLVIYYFFGVILARIGFYLPVLGVVLCIYLRRQKRGFFLESLAFILALSLAMMITVDLMGLV